MMTALTSKSFRQRGARALAAALAGAAIWFAASMGVPAAEVPVAQAPAQAGSAAAKEAPVQLAQRRRGSNFFDRLFGGKMFGNRSGRRSAPSQRRTIFPPQPDRPVPGAPVASQPRETPKDPDARTVVVFGDAFASGLGTALRDAFANTPTIEVVKRPKLGSGLVRYDFYDWDTALDEILATEKVDVAVIMLGSNDAQAFRDAGPEDIEWGSQEWQDAYIQRVDNFLRRFSERGIPVYWVGLPIMRAPVYAQDMAFLNTVFLARTQRAGGRFIDMWARFADETGKYSDVGPDVNGKIRRLRDENGIHMTGTGYRTLAFFVESELRNDLDTGQLMANIPGFDGAAGAARRRGPVEMEMSLTKPETPKGVVTLAGSSNALTPPDPEIGEDPPPDHRVLVIGESPAAQPGRADDFSWPRGSKPPAPGNPTSQP
jgi:hypothetical protein